MSVNPFEHPPVYKHDQVITEADLISLREEAAYQYKMMPRWQIHNRLILQASWATICAIIDWLREGKPYLREIQGRDRDDA